MEISFTIFSELCFPKNICKIPFTILPPSNGYIGSKLKLAITTFEAIINVRINSSILVIDAIIISNIFVMGPANAINIFFNSNSFPFFIFLLYSSTLNLNNIDSCYEKGITACFSIGNEISSLEKALKEGEKNLEKTSENIMRLLIL